MVGDILVVLLGYLLGSIPFAYLVTRLATGLDIRRLGDRNVGTRNTMRIAGRLAGLLTLGLDMGKGGAACWLARRYGSGENIVLLTGLALMVGHGFPVWLGWHGGKGLAAASGFFAVLWPLSVLGGAVTLLLAQRIARGFDLAFAIAAIIFVGLTLIEGNDIRGAFLIVLVLGSAGVKRLIDMPRERKAALAQCPPPNGQ
jgi:glycerol-3-phosphate acyltransferase PlsY